MLPAAKSPDALAVEIDDGVMDAFARCGNRADRAKTRLRLGRKRREERAA